MKTKLITTQWDVYTAVVSMTIKVKLCRTIFIHLHSWRSVFREVLHSDQALTGGLNSDVLHKCNKVGLPIFLFFFLTVLLFMYFFLCINYFLYL